MLHSEAGERDYPYCGEFSWPYLRRFRTRSLALFQWRCTCAARTGNRTPNTWTARSRKDQGGNMITRVAVGNSEWFWKHERSGTWKPSAELRVQVAATRFRVPDVTILDRNQPVEQIVTRAPVAVFEILSPEDSLRAADAQTEGLCGDGNSPYLGHRSQRTTCGPALSDGQLCLSLAVRGPGAETLVLKCRKSRI